MDKKANVTVPAQKLNWKQKLVAGSVVALASAQASAFEIQTILDGSGAEDNSDAIALFVLGVVIILFTLSMARRGLGK